MYKKNEFNLFLYYYFSSLWKFPCIVLPLEFLFYFDVKLQTYERKFNAHSIFSCSISLLLQKHCINKILKHKKIISYKKIYKNDINKF